MEDTFDPNIIDSIDEFEAEDSDVDAELEILEEEVSEEIKATERSEEESEVEGNPLLDPLTAAFILGLADEIADEERIKDGEPAARLNPNIEKISPLSKGKGAIEKGNFPEFFKHVIDRKDDY